MSSAVVAWWRIPTMPSASVLTFLPAGYSLSESKSKLCYDRRSVGQCHLISSPHLEQKTIFLLLSDSCGFVDVGRPLWREDGSVFYNCWWSSPAQSFSGQSPSGHMTICYCLRFDSPPTWKVPVFISPRNRVAQLYPQTLGSLFVASYDSQGYSAFQLVHWRWPLPSNGWCLVCFEVVA
jgi:hypothetical protein